MDKGKVQVPAVGLIVMAGLDALFALAFLCLSLLDLSTLRPPWKVEALPGGDAAAAVASGGLVIALCMVGLVIDAIIAYGGFKMMKLESYGFAVAAAFLAIIPCLSSPCFALGVPFGIWSLYVLMDPEVKEGFLRGTPVPKAPAG